jgi:all-trans-retinol dehydrogenase (NAD+)
MLAKRKAVLTALVLGYLLKRLYMRLRMKSLKGKIALITGAGTGIGQLLAVKLAKEHGMKVALWGRKRAPLESTEKQITAAGGKAMVWTCDVADKEQVYKTAKEVTEALGDVYLLVNNAGRVSGASLLDVPDTECIKSFEVNALSHLWTIKAFLPAMLNKNSGHIVSVASMAGQLGTAGLADYCGSKFAAVGIDEAIRFELRKLGAFGVFTTCICPFYIDTGMFEGAGVPFPASLLLPLLRTEYVVDQTITAIRQNREILLMPFCASLVGLGRAIFPVFMFDKLMELLGVSVSMDHADAGRTPKVAYDKEAHDD